MMPCGSLDVAGLSIRRLSPGREFVLTVPQLSLSKGGACALVGRSGSGKSTVLDLVGLVRRPDAVSRFALAIPGEGVLDIASRVLGAADDQLSRFRSLAVGYVLQTGGLLPFLSVQDNITLSIAAQRRVRPEDRREARWLAAQLGLADMMGAKPATLSVGERQRVAVARAIIHKPSIILADEPTAALDPTAANAVMEVLLDLVRSAGSALVIATHDHDLVDRFGVEKAVHRIEDHGAGRVRAEFCFGVS